MVVRAVAFLAFSFAFAAVMLWGALAPPIYAATLDQHAASCLACHGEKGQSDNREVPTLGAQLAPYTLIQLYMFRGRLRINDIMNQAMKDFTDDDLRRMSDFVAKLPAPRPAAGPIDSTRLERGRTFVRQYRCDFCHNPDLAGRDAVPRIAGQREDYLVKSMREYKANTRPGYDASMADVLQPITDAQILDLAYFAARQH